MIFLLFVVGATLVVGALNDWQIGKLLRGAIGGFLLGVAAEFLLMLYRSYGSGALGVGCVLLLVALGFIGNYGLLGWLFSSTEKQTLRGTSLVDQTRHSGTHGKGNLTIGGVVIPAEIESLSFGFFGSPGSGKSQAINRIACEVRARREPALVADAGGELMSHLFKDGDIIFNPLDERRIEWSPFAEMQSPWHADAVAKNMIPDGEGPDKNWHFFAQQVTACILRKLWEQKNATNQRLFYLLVAAPREELEAMCYGETASRIFEEANEKMLLSTLAVLGAHLSGYQYLDPNAGKDAFSFSKWVCDRPVGQWIWFNYRKDTLPALKFMISAAIGCFIKASLGEQRPDLSRRTFLFLDELAALGKINDLDSAAAQGRKYGVVVCAGIQTLAQLRESNGENGSQILLSCMQTTLCLRLVDHKTAEEASKKLGDAETSRQVESVSQSEDKRSTSIREERKVEKLILPSEIQSLPPLRGFLHLVGHTQIGKVDIPIVDLGEEKCLPFIPRSQGAMKLPSPKAKIKADKSRRQAIPAPAAAEPLEPVAKPVFD